MSIVELWDDLLKTDLILPSNIFKSASYLGIPDESRGKIWLHMVDQREKRCGTQHQSDFKVKISFFLRISGFSIGVAQVALVSQTPFEHPPKTWSPDRLEHKG